MFKVHIERVSGAEPHHETTHELGTDDPREDTYCENIICPTEASARIAAAQEATDQAVAQSDDGGVWSDIIEDDGDYANAWADIVDYMKGIDFILTQPIPFKYVFNGGHFIEVTVSGW